MSDQEPTEHLKTSRRRKRVTRFLKILIFTAVVWFFLGDVISNQLNYSLLCYRLSRVARDTNCQVLSQRSAFGLLVGNSNHCDYFAGLLLKSPGPPAEILRKHGNYTILNPKTNELEEVEILILDAPEKLQDVWLPDDYARLQSWGTTEHTLDEGTIFILYVMRSYEPNCDPRCH